MAYPKWLYHRELAPDGVLVAREDDEPSGEGWVITPAAFDPGYVPPPVLEPEVIVRGGRPYVAFPAWRYQANGDARLVETAEADAELDKSQWKDSPAAFTAPTVEPLTTPHNATPPAPTPPARSVVFADKKVKDKD